MPITTVRNILVAAGGVTALVGTRISPVIRAQDETLPCVVLTTISVAPTNQLVGAPTLDANRVQLDAYALTYAQTRAVADACRAALEAGGCALENENDLSEPDVAEYRITQDFLVWT